MEIEYIPAKTIISTYRATDNWFGYEYNMNIYKGCSHGCIYCDSRSDCYHIENFDKIRAKKNAIDIISYELSTKRRKGIVATGSMSDPYNPLEKELGLTRDALKLIYRNGFGVIIFTKSNLIKRDIDILKAINEKCPVVCCITITAADDDLSKIIEPNVCKSSERFNTIKELSETGIFTGVLMTPILPYITDTTENIMALTNLAHENGARFTYGMFGVTLRANQRQYYYDKLDEHFPLLKKQYIKTFDNKYFCNSPNSKELGKAFRENCKKLGLLYQMKDIVPAYRNIKEDIQLSLF